MPVKRVVEVGLLQGRLVTRVTAPDKQLLHTPIKLVLNQDLRRNLSGFSLAIRSNSSSVKPASISDSMFLSDL